MQKAVLFVILFGALAGYMMPSGRPVVPSADAVVSTSTGVPGESRVHRSDDGHFYVHAMVNRQLVRFLVDTGATGVVLTKIDADRVGIDVNPDNYEVVGSGASGPVQGEFVDIDSLELDGKRADNLRGIVADGLEVSLLGQSFLTRYQVQMNGDEMIIR